MVTLHIDGKEYDVNETDNLLQACLSLGFDIPYFCWHPALGSVGACRQCAVKQFQNTKDTHGHLIMSCMTSVFDGISISIEDAEAKEFRESVIEWLMTNHPHDCPVCEEGGSCHLQDMTVMTGHHLRRYRFTKRTHRNQDLGPFISHEMNRCIACYRCVRFYKDYADGKDLGVYGTHNNVYFGRLEDGTLESEFSGNLVEICPTGVFTDKTYSERYSRKWDMQFAPSVCQQCCVGCNTSPGERYGELRRIENRYNGSINRYFLCDRGRFGYGYVNLHDRPRRPTQLHGHDHIKLNAKQAVQISAEVLRQAKKVIGIGSSRASIESNFALRKLVGAANFSTGMPAEEQELLELILQILREGGIYTPSLREIENYDAVLVLGEDLTQVGARIALSVRQAIKGKACEMAAAQKVAGWQIAAVLNIGQNAKNPLFITNVDETCLSDIAVWSYCAPVEDQARLGFAIAHALDENAPAVKDFDNALSSKLDIVVQALIDAKKPLIISGVHSGSTAIIKAAANIAKALKRRGTDVGITLLASQANSIGLGLMGGNTLDSALTQLKSGEADVVVVLENDLYRHAPKVFVDAALNNATHVIVVDHQRTATLNKADLVLSAASFAESDGTSINHEGRAQRFFQVYDPAYYDNSVVILESWRWLYSVYTTLENRYVGWIQLDHVINALVTTLPHFKGLKDAAPDSSFRIHGQKIARSPHRTSGRTAMRSNLSVHEPRQPQDQDTMFAFSMEGNNQPSAPFSQIPFAWAPGWNSPQAWNKFQDKIGGKLRHGDPGVHLFKASGEQLPWFSNVPNAYSNRNRQLRVAPYYQLFGSEEMTQRAPVIQKRMSVPTIVLNPQDAAKLGVNNGAAVEFTCAGETIRLSVRFSAKLQVGQAGLPLGMPGVPLFLMNANINFLQEAKQ